ncbi:hypothetical protein C5167_007014 [Papaver somniferum]|uniref:Uncharacterized protein n=1 Tax=Papaver somniferum TaxID=3469 RepID=A0A4Y7JGP6_PAPSO|nr:hypothetical protein C5167_007014 [Papaver somniferum]
MGILNNQKGKSSSSSSVGHVDHKIRKKCFKNRIKGFEKKFYELGKLCDVKAVGVVHSEFINGVKALPEKPHEFDEVVMQFHEKMMKLCTGEEEEKVENNQRSCLGYGNPKFDNLCTVESLVKIERDLESIFVIISERENQLKAGDVTSSSSKGLVPNCDQTKNFGVIESKDHHYESTSLVAGSSNNVYDYGFPCSDYNQQQPQPEEEMNKSFGVLEATSMAVRSSKNLDDYGLSSSDIFNQEEYQPLISLDPFSYDMVCDQPFSDMIDLEYQRLNCSSSYMETMMNLTTPGPEFLLC